MVLGFTRTRSSRAQRWPEVLRHRPPVASALRLQRFLEGQASHGGLRDEKKKILTPLKMTTSHEAILGWVIASCVALVLIAAAEYRALTLSGRSFARSCTFIGWGALLFPAGFSLYRLIMSVDRNDYWNRIEQTIARKISGSINDYELMAFFLLIIGFVFWVVSFFVDGGSIREESTASINSQSLGIRPNKKKE